MALCGNPYINAGGHFIKALKRFIDRNYRRRNLNNLTYCMNRKYKDK